MQSRALEKTLLWVVKIGLFAVLFLPLYISTGMLFPFITGKNFFFRIIVEAVAVAWIGLMVLNAAYRPKLTPLVKIASVFIVVVFLADLFGANPFRSFFSNYERMEGFMMLSHLYLYFFMLVSVFKNRRDWHVFFNIAVIASLVVAFIGLMQKFGWRVSIQGGFRIDSTIGNPTYLAAYLSFNVWILAYLLRQFWQNWWLRGAYAASLIFELVIIYFTATRGAVLSFLVAVPLALIFAVIFWPRIFPGCPAGRKWVAGALALVLLAPLLLWQLRHTELVGSSQVLNRLTSISLEDRTIKSRFLIWQMSWRGFLERPILGWGQENYYLVFQRYFDPKLYAQELWFDRSHNIIFDWLIHAGLLGFAALFLMLGTAFWVLWRGVKNSSFDPVVGIIFLTGLLGYLIQNLFVFDNLNTYLMLFGFLAFTNFLSGGINAVEERSRARFSAVPRSFYPVIGGAIITFAALFYPLHAKPMLESKALIEALVAVQSKAPLAAIQSRFEKALSYRTFGDTETREQLASAARNIARDEKYSKEERTRFIAFAAEEMGKLTNTQVKDIKHMVFLASVLDRSLELNPAYAQEAEAIMKEAIRLSPTKQILYFELAQLYMLVGSFDSAFEVLRQALLLEPAYPTAQLNLIYAGLAAKRPEIITEAASFLPSLDIKFMNETDLKNLGTIYRNAGDYKSAKVVYEKLLERFAAPQYKSESAQIHATLAALLKELGEYERAIFEAERAAELDESFVAESKIFIDLVRRAQRGQ